IQQDDGWCYIGCGGCSKKLVREISSFTCLACIMLWLPSSKNRVIFTVSDDTDTEDFVSFDMEEGAQVLEAVQPEVVAQGSDPKLIRLAMLETSYLHLMVYLPDGFFKFKSADRNERREVSRSAPKAHYAPF
ncbi:hypothetical protein HID58_086909, partial [Brassica napus]